MNIKSQLSHLIDKYVLSSRKKHTTPLPPDDHCQWMLKDSFVTIPKFKRQGCYICEDPEFAQMGLPLCYACKSCKGHVPADSTICDDCGKEQEDD